MPKRHILDAFFDRANVNGVNDNFRYLFDDVSFVKGNVDTALSDLSKQKQQNEQNFSFLFDSVGEVKTLSNTAKQALDEAISLNAANVSTNERLDKIIADSGTSSTEVIDARGNYTVLNERLANQDKSSDYLKTKTKETSYMNFLQENSAQLDNNLVKVNSDRNIDVNIAISNNEYYKLNFAKNINDDFLKFRNADLIAAVQSLTYASANQDMIVGATLTGSGDNHYITNPGGTLIYKFTGTGISIHYYTDARGGVWKASVDGEFVKNVSTHIDAQSPSQLIQAAIGETNIIKGLQNGVHTLTLEFIGQDENYPTSSPRGWLKINSTGGNDIRTETFVIENFDTNTVNVLYDSNKEFAFDVNLNGNREWIPEHNNTGTLKLSSTGSQKLIIDNREVSINSTSAEQSFKELKILQNLYGYNSASTEPVCEVLCITTVTSRGVKFNTSFKWLQEVTVNGYVNMFTVSPKFADKLTSSYGNQYDIDIYDNSYEYLKEDAPFSYIATGVTYSDYYATIDNVNAWETLRLGASTRDGDEWGSELFAIQHRNDYLQKLYPKVYTNHITQPGEIYKFEGYFGFGKLPMVNKYV
ncbi:hypothetical protein ACIGHC_03175 [Staphylococcus saprophyticus]|uniref:hypothetical protein n=1 Tax=Staphylococcus saprophyticus TaxID=29385 RepID=UPI0037D0165A